MPSKSRTWISHAEALRLLEIGRSALMALVRSGRIERRHIPGSKPQLRLSDVLRVLAESSRPLVGAAGGSK